MTAAIVLATALVIATFIFHFSVLQWLSFGMRKVSVSAPVRVLMIVMLLIAAHIIEIGFYAVSYRFGVGTLALGSFGGLAVVEPHDYFYFSIVTYTSLGLGDVFPNEHLRFLAGVEALNGLLLISWSGAFIYAAMSRLWPWPQCNTPEGGTKTA